MVNLSSFDPVLVNASGPVEPEWESSRAVTRPRFVSYPVEAISCTISLCASGSIATQAF
jgi:hypothetical protein